MLVRRDEGKVLKEKDRFYKIGINLDISPAGICPKAILLSFQREFPDNNERKKF